ncbi:MAG: hypothetical protein CMJ86_08945 [Planctomycetes bacterium]|nr:hypothetical protein [Planctomycetota bacterium]
MIGRVSCGVDSVQFVCKRHAWHENCVKEEDIVLVGQLLAPRFQVLQPWLVHRPKNFFIPSAIGSFVGAFVGV